MLEHAAQLLPACCGVVVEPGRAPVAAVLRARRPGREVRQAIPLSGCVSRIAELLREVEIAGGAGDSSSVAEAVGSKRTACRASLRRIHG